MRWGSNAFTSWAPLGGYLAQAFALAVAAMDADSLVRKNLAPVLEAPADDPGVASLQAIMAALVGPVQSLTNNGPALSPCTVFILAAI
jgi:hypothetical protein